MHKFLSFFKYDKEMDELSTLKRPCGIQKESKHYKYLYEIRHTVYKTPRISPLNPSSGTAVLA